MLPRPSSTCGETGTAPGWGVIVPQQHRLVGIAPKLAPVLLALNNTATYSGRACSSLLGGLALVVVDRHDLSLVGAAMILAALVLAEVTHALIVRRSAAAVASDRLQPRLA